MVSVDSDLSRFSFFFFNDTATTEIYTLSLHDALPISMLFCLGTEGSNGSLFRNGWFQWLSVWELKVPMVPYLEMGGSKDRKSTRLNSSHVKRSRMPSSA